MAYVEKTIYACGVVSSFHASRHSSELRVLFQYMVRLCGLMVCLFVLFLLQDSCSCTSPMYLGEWKGAATV